LYQMNACRHLFFLTYSWTHSLWIDYFIK
jgi:hypothetical protein